MYLAFLSTMLDQVTFDFYFFLDATGASVPYSTYSPSFVVLHLPPLQPPQIGLQNSAVSASSQILPNNSWFAILSAVKFMFTALLLVPSLQVSDHRIIEAYTLENSLKIIKPNNPQNTTNSLLNHVPYCNFHTSELPPPLRHCFLTSYQLTPQKKNQTLSLLQFPFR